MGERIKAVLVIMLVMGGFSLAGSRSWVFLLGGLAVGYIIQRSQFCFLGALNDLLLLGQGEQARAVVLLLTATTAGFAWLQYSSPAEVPGFVLSVFPGTVLGGFIFGLGMVLAGGCILSTLARAGSGAGTAWLALAGIAVGSTLGARFYGRWLKRPRWGEEVFLPSLLGWHVALGLELLLLLLIWRLIRHWEQKSSGEVGHRAAGKDRFGGRGLPGTPVKGEGGGAASGKGTGVDDRY